MNRVIVDLIVCAVWLAVCIFLITQIKEGKTGKIIGVSILFILYAALTAGSSFCRIIATEKINETAVEMEEYLVQNFNNQLVRDGVDVSNASQAIGEIESMVLIKINQLGAKGFAAKELYKIAGNQVSKTLRTKTDTIISYAEKEGNGKITVKTVFNVVKDQLFKVLKIVVLIIHLIVYLLMAIRLLRLIMPVIRKA